jgi:hypothetical protein
MAECDWAILCDHAFPDLQRKMNLIGIFDRVNAASIPSSLAQSAIVVKLVGEPGERVALRLVIVRPTQAHLADIPIDVVLSEQTGTAEVQLGLAGMPLPDEGPYAFQLFNGQELLKQVTVSVGLIKSEPPKK